MKFKLTRTGRAPLEFDGEIVAQVSTHNLRGDEQNRWYEITLCEVSGAGGSVGYVRYVTKWEGELNHHWAINGHISDIEKWLTTDLYPIPDRIGWPPRREFDSKQAALMADLKSQYEYAVSKVLEGFPEVL